MENKTLETEVRVCQTCTGFGKEEKINEEISILKCDSRKIYVALDGSEALYCESYELNINGEKIKCHKI